MEQECVNQAWWKKASAESVEKGKEGGKKRAETGVQTDSGTRWGGQGVFRTASPLAVLVKLQGFMPIELNA